MKYYSIRIGIAEDGETPIQSLTVFDTIDGARQKFHNDMFGYIGHSTRICCLIVDSVGNVIAREHWSAEDEAD